MTRAGHCPPAQTRGAGMGAPEVRKAEPGPGRSASRGPISPATSAAPGPREGSRCSWWANQGGSHRHLPPQPSSPRAAGCWRQTTAALSRSEKVRFGRAVARSAPPRAGRAARSRPAFRLRPRPQVFELHSLGKLRVSRPLVPPSSPAPATSL